MNLSRPLCTFASLLGIFCAYYRANAEDVRGGMTSLLTPFREIQPYIVNEDLFSAADNEKRVSQILQDLRKNFHHLESVPSRYHELPGFDENLRSVTDLLDDSGRRFNEGKKSYAWWRLRKLPTDCFTCHSTYKVTSRYANEDVVDKSLDPLNRARFQLATRQFAEAQKSFSEVLRNPDYQFNFDESLRSLLLITTRINQNPADGIALFKEILITSKLPEEDAREVQRWIQELAHWSDEKNKTPKDPIAFGEKLITSGLSSSPDTFQNDVALLRGTALLHQQLEAGSLPKERRPRALYLLGFAYSQLPLFFAESWAEMYLERCIAEFPGSADAKLAFKVYRDRVIDDYTGTGGAHIPDEVRLRLEELRKKAYGEPSFGGMVRANPAQGSFAHYAP